MNVIDFAHGTMWTHVFTPATRMYRGLAIDFHGARVLAFRFDVRRRPLRRDERILRPVYEGATFSEVRATIQRFEGGNQ